MKVKGKIFRGLIKEKYTQEKFAILLHTNQNNLASWIKRDSIPDKYEDKVLELLGVTADELKGNAPLLFDPVELKEGFAQTIESKAKLIFNECDQVLLAPESSGYIEKNDFIGVVDIPLDDFDLVVSGKKYLIKTKYTELLRVINSINKESITIANGDFIDTLPIEKIEAIQMVKAFAQRK